MKMWTVYIRDQTARSVQSDLDVHCPQKLLVSSTVMKDLSPSSLLEHASCICIKTLLVSDIYFD